MNNGFIIVEHPEGTHGMNLHVVLTDKISEIQRLEALLAEYGKTHQFSNEVIQDINLVLEEAVSNIVFYGYNDKAEHRIDLDISLEAETLVLEIRDDGKAFNPLNVPEPDLDVPLSERKPGGMGIHLIRALTDELEYKRTEGKNVLLMKKYL